ncbi:MAG: hypothetical protein H7174_04060 [Flavobacterium sp.]|nr:hypothetical protein [Flavobacterium sp.]
MEIRRNTINNTIEFLTYLGGDGYNSPVVLKSDGTTNTLQNYLYLHRDYQGSILAITDNAGVIKEKRLFDAWGSLIKFWNSGSSIVPTTEGQMLIDRGYTGHEHLIGVGLINMNGRLYDPALHRFLSPDNNLQDPNNTQNYNRYGYCLNNPFKYSDMTGESFWSDIGNFFSDAFKSLVKVVTTAATVVLSAAVVVVFVVVGAAVGVVQYVGSGFKDSSILTNEAKILGGLFQGNIGQIASRFTKELPQTLAGLGLGLLYNAVGRVKSVSYLGGATAIETYDPNWGAYTLGSFIIGENGLQASSDNDLFKHEYGHYLQSQDVGWDYIYDYAIPSAINAYKSKDNFEHMAFNVEQDANIRGRDYFGNWNYNYYPIFDSGFNNWFDLLYKKYR